MRSLLLLPLLICCVAPLSASIAVDQFGYPSDERKIAVIKRPATGADAATDQFNPGNQVVLRDLQSDSIVWRGTPEVWNNGAVHTQSGDRAWMIDFSKVTRSGNYRLEDPTSGRISHPFEIRKNPWKAVLRTAGRTFFYQRIGFPKEAKYTGNKWADRAAYLQDSAAVNFFDQSNPSAVRDLRGGWFDAGDYNKYVTFARTPVHEMLNMYRLYPDIWGDDWNIPESGNGLPDLLDELKWELNWLLRMQNSNGSVLLKMGEKDYGSSSPPSSDKRTRYYGRTATSATISFASMTAHAALIYRNFPEWELFADTLQSAALRAWDHYSAQPVKDTDADQGEIKSGDADMTVADQTAEEVVTAAYFWLLTKEEKWNTLVAGRYNDISMVGWWGPYDTYTGDALLLYSQDGASNSAAVAAIRNSAAGLSYNLKGVSGEDPWGVGLPDNQYHWGSLSVMARVAAVNLHQAEYLGSTKADFRNRALDILNYFHGKNPLGQCYLSNMGEQGAENSVDRFYHGWFGHGSDWSSVSESKFGPAPGYVVGGPNKDFTTENPYLPLGQPPQKMYADFNDPGVWPAQYNAWEITENAIYYQSVYMRVLAAFVNTSNDTLSFSSPSAIQSHREIQPLTSQSHTLYNISGKEVARNLTSPEEVSALPIPRGIYLLVPSSSGRGAVQVIKQ